MIETRPQVDEQPSVCEDAHEGNRDEDVELKIRHFPIVLPQAWCYRKKVMS